MLLAGKSQLAGDIVNHNIYIACCHVSVSSSISALCCCAPVRLLLHSAQVRRLSLGGRLPQITHRPAAYRGFTPLTHVFGGSLRVFLALLDSQLVKIPQGTLRVLSRTRGAGRAAAACFSLAAAYADAVRLKPLILLAVIHRRTRRRMPHSLPESIKLSRVPGATGRQCARS